MSSDIKRLAPDQPFPAYAYIGIGQPHPRRHPDGHSYHAPDKEAEPLHPQRWTESTDYAYGLDLFNHGYYWEAHEAWEGLWHAAGRKGSTANFLKGLIRLAAAGVKVRQAMPEGVRLHAQGAITLFESARADEQTSRFAGFDFSTLIEFAEEISRDADLWPRHEGKTVAVVFPKALLPEQQPAP